MFSVEATTRKTQNRETERDGKENGKGKMEKREKEGKRPTALKAKTVI